MLHADYANFKWPIRRFRDYLERQLEKQGVTVHLGTEATPEGIRAIGYDAIIAAVGAVPKKPRVQGADSSDVLTHVSVFGREHALGKHVIVVGGSESATETALYLAQSGHQVTILTRRERLATDAQFSHYYSGLEHALREQKELRPVTCAKTVAVTDKTVTYLDRDGVEHTVVGDNVVACGGMRALQQEAVAFAECADQFFAIGDCNRVGNIHTCTRSAFSAAMQI